MFFTPSYYAPRYAAYPSYAPSDEYDDDYFDPHRLHHLRAARLAAAEEERARAAERALLQRRRRQQAEAEQQLLRELQLGAPRETKRTVAPADDEIARAKKKLKQQKMRARTLAAKRIEAAFRGHRVRHHERPLEELRAAHEQHRAAAALDALEHEIARVYAEIVEPAKAAPTAGNTHVASEHLMRLLLKLDEHADMAGANALRARRKTLSAQLDRAIAELDRMSEELSSAQPETTQDELSDDDGASDKLTHVAADGAHASEEEEADADDAEMVDAQDEIVTPPSEPTVAEADASAAPTVEELQRTIRELQAQNQHLRKLLAVEQLSRRRVQPPMQL